MIYDVAIAVGPKGEFGKEGGLPWPRLPNDMEQFKTLTAPSNYDYIICGNNTFESLPEGYKKSRMFLVVSSTPKKSLENAVYIQLDAQGHRTLEDLESQGTAIFIGGATLLNRCSHILDNARSVFLTEVYGEEANKLKYIAVKMEHVQLDILQELKDTRFNTLLRDDFEIEGFHSKTTRYW